MTPQDQEALSRQAEALGLLVLSDGSFALFDQNRRLLTITPDPSSVALAHQPVLSVKTSILRAEVASLRLRGQAQGLLPSPASTTITLAELGLL